MRIRALLVTLVLIAVIPLAAGGNSGPAIDAAAAFARLKSLAGTWEGDSKAMGKVRVVYEVVADGSAILEKESGEKMPVMVTLYHLDGSRLLLTHYCMVGNQPRMEAKSFDARTGDLTFDFIDATNFAKPEAGHMHAVKYRFIDATKFTSTWQFYENGQPTLAETTTYTRVK